MDSKQSLSDRRAEVGSLERVDQEDERARAMEARAFMRDWEVVMLMLPMLVRWATKVSSIPWVISRQPPAVAVAW